MLDQDVVLSGYTVPANVSTTLSTPYKADGRFLYLGGWGWGWGLFLLFYVVVVVVTHGKLYASSYDLSKTRHRSVLWLIFNSYYWDCC